MGEAKNKMLSVVDLFAGCGGFSLGLEQAGFTPVYVNELDGDARSTYLSNRLDRFEWFSEGLSAESWLNPFCSADIKRMTQDDYLRGLQRKFRMAFGIHHGEIDLVVGGPPCQGFSGIGHRRSYAVAKKDLPSNHLYKEMVRVVGALRPRAFVFENVRGLLTGRWSSGGVRGEIWRDVKRAFAAIGEYNLAAELIFAKDYGVAQNRPRVLLIGIRKDLAGEATGEDEVDLIDGTAIARGMLPKGDPRSAPDIVNLLGDLIDPDYENGGSTKVYPNRWTCNVQRELRTSVDGRKVSGQGDPLTEHEYSKHRPDVAKRFAAMIHGRKYEPTRKFAQRVLPRRWDRSGPTITATSLPDDYVHFEQPRTLSVREWARLQGFPDWYQFKGKRTTGGLRRAGNPVEGIFNREVPKYTQIGNAVPVPVARAVGSHLARLLTRR